MLFQMSDSLKLTEQLAIVTSIRQQITVDELDTHIIMQLLQNQSLINIIFQILSQPRNPNLNSDDQEIMRYLKLEAGWVLTNLSQGDDACMKLLAGSNDNEQH